MTAGRVCLVTGASGGIGRAVAVALAEGSLSPGGAARVGLGWAGNEEAALQSAKEVEAAGGEARAVRIDVTDPESVEAAFADLETSWGPVEVLVNSAGITRDGLLMRMSEQNWSDVLRTNLDGAFRTTRRAVPKMVRARFGRIVNIGSVSGSIGTAGQANYAAAKAGLLGLTRSTARELASRGITCNVVAPGPITSAMTEAMTEEQRQAMTRSVPLGRFGTAEEVGAVVAFLCSDIAGYVTGALIPVDGGLGMGSSST